MRYLLDTNVLSDARRRTHPELNEWIAGQPRTSLSISVVTLLELERGVLRLERRDFHAGMHLRSWLTDIATAFSGSVLAVDEHVACYAARLHVPDPMPEMDALIAATALQHELTLVTRIIRDFQSSGVNLLDTSAL